MVRIGRGYLRSEDHPHPPGQPRHVRQAERQTMLGELVVVPAVELAPCGDCAHLVVEVGPPHMASAMAEPDELDDVRGGVWRAASGADGRAEARATVRTWA